MTTQQSYLIGYGISVWWIQQIDMEEADVVTTELYSAFSLHLILCGHVYATDHT